MATLSSTIERLNSEVMVDPFGVYLNPVVSAFLKDVPIRRTAGPSPGPVCSPWPEPSQGGRRIVRSEFKIGDHVSWNSEAGRVRGIIRKKITAPMTFKGYTVHASKEAPQYLIESDKTDHLAMHKGPALRKTRGPAGARTRSTKRRSRRHKNA